MQGLSHAIFLRAKKNAPRRVFKTPRRGVRPMAARGGCSARGRWEVIGQEAIGKSDAGSALSLAPRLAGMMESSICIQDSIGMR